MLPLTYIIIGITCLVSFIAFGNKSLLNRLVFNAYQVAQHKEYWRLFSNGLIHGGQGHLLLNMFVLFMFGTHVEDNFASYFTFKGPFYFIVLYVGALFFSSLPSLRKHSNNPAYNSLGASGATSAVLFSFIVMEPTAELRLYFAIPISAFLAGIGFLFYESYQGKKGGTGIAHDAHFAGAIFGILFTIFIRPQFVPEFIAKVGFYLGTFFGS